MFLDESGNADAKQSLNSHLASGVPGTVDGLLKLHARYGSKPLADLLEPAIEMAEQGIMIEPEQVARFNRLAGKPGQWVATVEKFSRGGEAFSGRERWKQPLLARTLREIAAEGRQGFYEGWVAESIASEMARGGGLMSLDDLKRYESVWRDPARTTYRGYDIWSMGPPSSGGILIAQILNMLEPFNLGAMGWGSARLTHLVVEAERRAYADRSVHLGDPDFWKVPADKLMDVKYARERMKDFNPERLLSVEKYQLANGLMKVRIRPITA